MSDERLAAAARVLRVWQEGPSWVVAPEELVALDALCAAHEPPPWPPVEYGPLEPEGVQDGTDSGPGFYTTAGVIIGPRCCDDLVDMLVRHSLEPVDEETLVAWFAERKVSSPRSAAAGAIAYLRRRELVRRGKDGRGCACYYLRIGHRREDDGSRIRDEHGRYY